MRKLLIALFGGILVWMVIMTVQTSLTMNIVDSMPLFRSNPWAVATLWDAYFGFLTFYVWVAWRERGWGARVLWLVLIMTLGNIAMSGYMLIQLFRLGSKESLDSLLRRPQH